MSDSSSSSSGGTGFIGLLQVLFIGLKLTNYITWPWWQVLLPTIIGLSLVGILLLFALLIIYLPRK
jgi:hypothetical protein